MSSSLRVLVVDSDEESVRVLRCLIAQAPVRMHVETAPDFAAGLERMTSERWDAHLVASRLGARSGVGLVRAYREAGGESPVFVIAGTDDRAEDLAAMESGAAGYLVKPRLDAALLERSLRYAVKEAARAASLRAVRDELEASVAQRADALMTMNVALGAEVAERRAAAHALREAAQRKDEFLATLAHELRNPLAPLSSAAEILSRTADTPGEAPRRAHAIGVIERQVAQMVRLIDDLLDVSRITHGKVELRRSWVTLSSVVESALETSGPLLAGRGHSFELALPEKPVLLHVDPMRVAQILSNLLSNAAKYTDPGGRIRLEAVRDGAEIVVSVVDSGIGIPEAHLSHVFTMFGQGHQAHRPVHGGLGIGLAFAKSIAEMHGGSLTAASEGEGKGSVFTLRLVCAPESAGVGAAEEAPASAAAAPRPRRILIVDDNVEAALTLAELLSLAGHETHVAHDGPSGVDKALRLKPDVTILDIGLPGFDGLEAARRLRARPDLSRMLLVAVSGWVQPADRERSRQAGFDHHVAKPVQLRNLERILLESPEARVRTA